MTSFKPHPAFLLVLVLAFVLTFSHAAPLTKVTKELQAALQANITLLSEGVGVTTSVPVGGYDYYVFPVFTVSTLNLTVTALNGSDPDLFASMTTPYPSMSNNQWASMLVGSEVILIPKAQVGLYYIAVLGWDAGKGKEVAYSIVAQTRNNAEQE